LPVSCRLFICTKISGYPGLKGENGEIIGMFQAKNKPIKIILLRIGPMENPPGVPGPKGERGLPGIETYK
jgi:hypothetical protein